MRALVVDDSLTMRKILRNILQEMGMEAVEEAPDGEAAVALTAQNPYDVVLMDWNMPKMLGIDALKAIRARGNAVPIIMVTTEAEKQRVIEALKDGANNYVVKPFDKEILIKKIRQTLEKAAAG